MESSFRSRVDLAFGALLGSALLQAKSSGNERESDFWSVSGRAIATERVDARAADLDSGSESDEPQAADYESFVRLERRGRRRRRDVDEDIHEENSEDERSKPKRRRRGESEGHTAAERMQQELDDEEVREMRLMIGMDETLDFEEEEDEYDKVAVGREGAGERVYMREIKDVRLETCPPPTVSLSVGGLGTFERDSRANHAAAAARLNEDREAEARCEKAVEHPSLAMSLSSVKRHLGMSVGVRVNRPELERGLEVSGCENSAQNDGNKESSNLAETRGDPCDDMGREGEPEKGTNMIEATKEGRSLGSTDAMKAHKEPNIKRDAVKDQSGCADKLPREEKVRKFKKVRFDLDENLSEELKPDIVKEKRVVLVPTTRCSQVPDHVRNPSKYTHYTLDWSDDEEDGTSNLSAFQAFQTFVSEPATQEVSIPKLLPKSIVFVPKNGVVSGKGSGVEKRKEAFSAQAHSLISFAEDLIGNDGRLDHGMHNSVPGNILVDEAKTTRVFRKRARESLDEDFETSVASSTWTW